MVFLMTTVVCLLVMGVWLLHWSRWVEMLGFSILVYLMWWFPGVRRRPEYTDRELALQWAAFCVPACFFTVLGIIGI